ncbi:hypothetical protein OF83DRAFT_362902 [Amylostereum chailletii]|nr:hypothetical protein OF83DRAFT_362902 [Amylostereum chailletii]
MRPLYACGFALTCLVALNALATYLLYKDPKASSPARQYTYVGDDYPELWPLPPTPPVTLVVEEPVHLPILGPDARQEWASTSPKGISYIRIGPEHRAFAVTMLHELHCLRLMRAGLAGDYRPASQEHFAHCLNYIRQMILCSPDLTLEPANVLERDFDAERSGGTHVCRDWRQVYDLMDDNWTKWVDLRTAFTNASGTGYAITPSVLPG